MLALVGNSISSYSYFLRSAANSGGGLKCTFWKKNLFRKEAFWDYMKEMETNDISPDSRKKRPFHPADPPHGSKNYDPEALESEQKTELTQRKLSMRKENELYFKKHPEIQGFVSMILRHLLDKKPYTTDQVQDLVGLFFARPLQIIASELLDYLREIKYEGSLITELSQMKQQRPKMQ